MWVILLKKSGVRGIATALLLLALAAIPSAWAQTGETGQKWALLIGIEQYQSDEIRALNFTLRDVDALKNTLPLTGFASEHILTMTSDLPNKNINYPTNTNILKRLETLKKQLRDNDTLLIYFSGHGFQEQEGGQNFLGSVNADISSPTLLKKTTVSLEELRDALKGLKASQLILIMDCCRNNPFKDGPKGGADDNRRTASFTRDLSLVSDTVGKKTGTAILFACQEGQRSWEDPDKEQGAFTIFLLEGLKGKAARDGVLTVSDLGSYVEDQMREWCIKNAKDQSPDYNQFNRARIVIQQKPVADLTAHLRISGLPSAARIEVDGQKLTGTEYSVNLSGEASKLVQVKVTAPGHEGKLFSVTLRQGETVSLPLTMEAVAPPPVPVNPPPTRPNEGGMVGMTNPKDGAELVLIPAGPFLMGDDDQKDNKRRTVMLSGYYIYKNLVTVGMYETFCKATNRQMPDAPDFNASWSKKDHPIVRVSWYDAKAYCDWAGAKLPSEAQWEKAARGTDGRKYPWGDTFNKSKLWRSAPDYGDANGTARVGAFPEGASRFGVLDMAGNVWQWCEDWYDPSNDYKIKKGGYYSGSGAVAVCCSDRIKSEPDDSDYDLGFRCVVVSGI